MKKFLIVGILCVFLGGIVFFLTKKSPSETPPMPQSASWKGVIPGKTTSEELYKNLGQPLAATDAQDKTILSFPSNNQYWNTEVAVQNNTVSFVKEWIFPIESGSFSAWKSKLKTPSTKLFGPDTASNMFLFVYPTEGVALLADPDKDIAFQVWYFPPTSLQLFLTLPETAGFSLTEPSGGDI